MNSKPKILFVCSWYPSRETAKLGNFIQRHAEAVSSLMPVHVFYAIDSEVEELSVQKRGNLQEHILYFRKRWPLLSYLSKSLAYLRKLHRQEKFDLIHLQVAYPGGLLVPALSLPYLLTEHFSAYQPQSGYRWGYLKKLQVLGILNKARIVLPVSQHLGKALRQFGMKAPLQKMSNVVDTAIFKYSNTSPERFTFLHISSLEERSKNISGLLTVYAGFCKKFPSALLKIGGDGDLRYLRQMIQDREIPPHNIEVIGPLDYAEVAQQMQTASCLLMFSHFENQPCTILEALCCGLPVISSEVGGIPEEINAKNGLLCPPGDEASLLATMEKMIEVYPSYQLENIAKVAQQRYSIASIAAQHRDLYLSVLNADA